MQLEDGKLYIDNSTLRAVAECSTEAVMRYIFDLNPVQERAPLKMGSAAHEAMALFLKGASSLEAVVHYDKLYKEWADENVPPDDRLTHENTSKVLKYWFETHPKHLLPYTVDPRLVEVGFALPLTKEDDIIFTGRIDIIGEDKITKDWGVIDHKFPGRVNAQLARNTRMDSQPSGYLWAARQCTDKPVTSFYVNAVEMSKVPSDPTRKCKEHKVPYEECGVTHAKFELLGPFTRSDEQLEEWRKTAIHLAKKFRDLATKYKTVADIHKVRMQGMFHRTCGFCGLYDWCSSGRQKALIGGMFVNEPWNPLEHAGVPAERLTAKEVVNAEAD